MRTPSFLPGAAALPGSAADADTPLALDVHRSFAGAQAPWRELQARAQAHPYQCFDWLAAWHEHIGRDTQPFIVVAREAGGAPAMLLPLALEQHLGVSRLVAMGSPVGDYDAPIVDAAFAGRLAPARMRAMLEDVLQRAGASYLLLRQVPPVVGTAPNPYLAVANRPFSSNAHSMALGSDWETFFTERRSSKTRARLRRKEKAMAEHGPLVFEALVDPASRIVAVEQLLDTKTRQLHEALGASHAFAEPGVHAFFRQLARGAPEGLAVFRLAVGERTAGLLVGLVHGGCFYLQVSANVDPAFEPFSPGQLLFTRVMAWAIGRGCTRFDFTVGDEPYKTEWCDTEWALQCGALARTAQGRAAAELALAAIAAKRWVKQHPALFHLARRAGSTAAKFGARRRPVPS